MTLALITQLMQAGDVPVLSEFWYDHMALLVQTNPRIRLLPDARVRWEQAVQDWLTQPRYVCQTARAGDEVIGGMIAVIVPPAPGLAPQQLAHITYLVVDIHTRHTRNGVGRVLLEAVRLALRERKITQLITQVGAQSAVEQAFWRGVGARHDDDLFWMDV
jgi:ribosomal protein S18 acetylase RimI-like enzyme